MTMVLLYLPSTFLYVGLLCHGIRLVPERILTDDLDPCMKIIEKYTSHFLIFFSPSLHISAYVYSSWDLLIQTSSLFVSLYGLFRSTHRLVYIYLYIEMEINLQGRV